MVVIVEEIEVSDSCLDVAEQALLFGVEDSCGEIAEVCIGFVECVEELFCGFEGLRIGGGGGIRWGCRFFGGLLLLWLLLWLVRDTGDGEAGCGEDGEA